MFERNSPRPQPTVVLDYHGVNLTHGRLPELAKLADAAKPFYEWLEQLAQAQANNSLPLSENLLIMSEADLRAFIMAAYLARDDGSRPSLFDGIGRQYSHRRAVYYFLAWLVRDAPQQRLAPLIAKVDAPREPRLAVEAGALARLFVAYRTVLGTFDWIAMREVIMDRLEGSRRSIRGRASEIVVRTAATAALQEYFGRNHSYGRFEGINVPDREVRIGGETFDVSVDLLSYDRAVRERILMPVKTRETEGGGHSYLFTRDVEAAIAAARRDGEGNWVAAWIIAQNWSAEKTDHVASLCDFAVALAIDPADFETVDATTQEQLNKFVAGVLDGTLSRKGASS
jgi:hypothetical protein